VAGCGFLAYSCAAARELHPLPIAPACRRPTIMREPNFEKEQKQQPSKSTGHFDTKSIACGVTGVSPVKAGGRAGTPGSPLLRFRLLVFYYWKFSRSYLLDVLLGEAGYSVEGCLQLPLKLSHLRLHLRPGGFGRNWHLGAEAHQGL